MNRALRKLWDELADRYYPPAANLELTTAALFDDPTDDVGDADLGLSSIPVTRLQPGGVTADICEYIDTVNRMLDAHFALPERVQRLERFRDDLLTFGVAALNLDPLPGE